MEASESFGFLVFPENASAPPVGLAEGAWENGPNGLEKSVMSIKWAIQTRHPNGEIVHVSL
jgi:hypothetical protein